MAFGLLIARGSSCGQQHVVVEPIRIGRDAGNDLILHDAGVSRQHTRIYFDAGRPWVEDLGSVNGTLVNGERIAQARELRAGDALAIGTALLSLVEVEGPKAQASTEEVVPAGIWRARTVLKRAWRRRLSGLTLGAQAAHWWKGLRLKTQAIAVGAGAVIAVGGSVGLWQFLLPDPMVALPSEPSRLEISSAPLARSFGLGDGVDYPCPEEKELSFELVAPTEVAILVHYRADEIDRDEVVVRVNGVEVGFVAADIGQPDRQLETLIGQQLLKRGEKNTLVFDNVRNPPGKESWRVFDLWLELLPVPAEPDDQAIARARDLVRHAGLLYTQRDVGPQNVFRAWKAYRLSWQLLLGVPAGKRSPWFEQARRSADGLGQELDRQCGALMLEAKKQVELKNPERAKEILLEVGLYFPTDEHRCHALADQLRMDL